MKRYLLPESPDLDAIAISEVDTPVPQRHQALVRMRAVSLNYRDLAIARGEYQFAALRTTGIIPLSDGAGEVVGTGADVTRVKPGDRVVIAVTPGLVSGPATPECMSKLRGAPCDGVLAEYVAIEEQDLVVLPDNIGFAAAACFPCAGVTAWNSLYGGPQPLLPGQTVLALGTGGVAMMAVQLARIGGARPIVTSSSDAKLEKVIRLGAWQGINYKTHPEWQDEVLRLTDGIGVDHTVETGGPGTLSRSVAATRFGGSLSLVGVLAEGMINPLNIMHQGLVVRTIMTGSRTMLEDLIRAFSYHRLEVAIDRIFPFAEAAAAYHYLAKAAHVGKVVIAID